MIKDMPEVWEGEARRYGSLTQGSAVRDLTREEIVWNRDLIADERNFPPEQTGIEDSLLRQRRVPRVDEAASAGAATAFSRRQEQAEEGQEQAEERH